MTSANNPRSHKKAPTISPSEIVERFVLRARRIAAHSLSQSRARSSLSWFMLRLMFAAIWNHMLGAQTADSHQPAERSLIEPDDAS